MKLIKKYCLVFIFTVSAHSVSATQDLVYGIDIKNAAEEYLNKHNVDNQVVISKNRAFFPCKQKIFIAPKRAGNYTTLKASCDNPASWTITVRTKIRDQGTKTKEGQNSRVKTPTIVFAKRNIPKDQVIQHSDLVLKPSERKNTLGAYINIDHIIGHKSKKNIARSRSSSCGSQSSAAAITSSNLVSKIR